MTEPSESRGQKLHAFWRYDMFSHTLSAVVEEFSIDGRSARMKGYGSDRYSYFALLPDPAGKELGEALVALGRQKAAAQAEINRDYDHRLHELFGKYGVIHPRYAAAEERRRALLAKDPS